MESAFCATNKKNYDIANFTALSDTDLERLRRNLFCIECGEKGFYRKKSRDGKPACFGAYHKDDCEFKSKDSDSRYDPETTEDVHQISTNNQIIDINFDTYTSSQLIQQPTGRPTPAANTGSHSKKHTEPTAQNRNMTRGLRTLLRMLMKTDTFAQSDIGINVGKYTYHAKKLFVNFTDINESHIDKWRGYWGMISHSNSEITWLNTANEKDVSIPVANIKIYLSDTFGVQSEESYEGAYVLVFGWLNISKTKGKWYIRPDSPAHVFTQLNH